MCVHTGLRLVTLNVTQAPYTIKEASLVERNDIVSGKTVPGL